MRQDKPKHFIYFDEDYIVSYLSQLEEGFLEEYRSVEIKREESSKELDAKIFRLEGRSSSTYEYIENKRFRDYMFSKLSSLTNIINCSNMDSFVDVVGNLKPSDLIMLNVFIHFFDLKQAEAFVSMIEEFNELTAFAAMPEDEYKKIFVSRIDKHGRQEIIIPKDCLEYVKNAREKVMGYQIRNFIKKFGPFYRTFVNIDYAIRCYINNEEPNYFFGILKSECLRENMGSLKINYGVETQNKFTVIAAFNRQVIRRDLDVDTNTTSNNEDEQSSNDVDINELIDRSNAGLIYIDSKFAFLKSQEIMYSPVQYPNCVITPIVIYH